MAVQLLLENIKKYQDMLIIELTSAQIFSLVKGSKLESHAQLIKKLNIDGFNLICSLSDWDILRDIRNYFADVDIKTIMEVSFLFMTQYFRQIMLENRKKSSSQLSNNNIQKGKEDEEDNFQNIVK